MKGGDMLKRFKARLSANGPGLTIAVIAMLVALTGGAFAAAGLTGPQKKEVEKIAKKVITKAGFGKKVIAGPAGPAGPAGSAGPTGPAGANGTNGKDGTNGTNGKSVTVGAEPKGANCAEGGTTVEKEGEAASKKFVCNGKEGSPWTAGGTLPPGATEYGAWAFSVTKGATSADTPNVHVALSFPIRLASPLGASAVHYQTEVNFGTFCGAESSTAEPKPEPGQLCVYNSGDDFPSNVTFEGICRLSESLEGCTEGEKGANIAGALLVFSKPTAASTGSGTFAVRAPLGS